MYKNQLQELAQRSCFNLPSYACIREGPDHAPRFKASVNFNGEIFESSIYCTTLRQAEHSAAEVALNVLSSRGPSRSLTARVLDETGIYKNLLQETAHRAGLRLPVYTTVRSGPGHVPTFTCTVELAGMNFTGDSAKTKKQAEKNAAIAAWSALNKTRSPALDSFHAVPRLATNKVESNEEQKQASVTRVLSNYRPKDDANKHVVRRREQQNPPKRIFRSSHHHNNNNNNNNIIPASTSNSNMMSLHDDERWKLMDLVMELGQQDGSLQKHLNSFASLLPPPPPRTSSKILPPRPPKTTTTIKTTVSSHCSAYSSIDRPIPVQVRSRTSQIVPPPPLDQDHHQKNEEEWLGKNNHPIEREGLVYGSSSSFSTGKLASFGSSSSSSSSSSGISVPRRMYSGQYSPHPHRMAPAVHIRSVIPVCASPPPPPPPSSATTTTEETPKSISNASCCSPPPSTTTTSTSVSTQPGGGDVSTASSKFNKLQL
ncbi:hypothetical protein TIFTF001_026563 [Ficus carica]|uniref:DRBM domain-containing protein n=1 Tax=Ficus carica TaxID=3494 RepID=A0AA88IX24_FICCA|nr:hypothetical protein TIFTF001_026563 [Ficus carica]